MRLGGAEQPGRNRSFPIAMGVIFLAQFVFVSLGGEVLSVHALTANTWLVCALLAFLVIPLDVARKMLTDKRRQGDA